MIVRPRAHATLLSELVKVVPARLTKKLDASPRAADAWTWAEGAASLTVTTDTNETVTIPRTTLTDVAQVKCTCLLSPRCFHVLATVAILDVDDPGDPSAPAEPSPTALPEEVADSTEATEAGAETVGLTQAQRDAAEAAFLAAERVLVAGATAAGAVLQGELLRAAHAARSEGLPRLASAALRACRTLRGLREERPEITLPGLAGDLRELLAVSHAIRHDRATSSDIGVARRAYETLGNLVLTGLFSEPVVGNGYAGVVTTLCDAKGRLFTIRDVMPGEPVRARSAYGLAVRMGDTSIPHDDLVRDGLFVESATSSIDRRLGAGSKVKAVRRGPTKLEDVASLFTVPVATQIARAYDALETPQDERPETADLVFLEVEILGSDTRVIHVRSAPPPSTAKVSEAPSAVAPAVPRFRLVPAHDAPDLAYIDNLRLIGRAPGLRARLVARVLFDRPGTVAPLLLVPPSVPPEEGEPRLSLPPAWSDRVCLGFDRMQSAHIIRGTSSNLTLPVDQGPGSEATRFDPLAPLRRRLQRAVLGGARTLSSGALHAVDEERRALARAIMPHADHALGAFAVAGVKRDRMGEAWLTLATYESAATRALLRATFLRLY